MAPTDKKVTVGKAELAAYKQDRVDKQQLTKDLQASKNQCDQKEKDITVLQKANDEAANVIKANDKENEEFREENKKLKVRLVEALQALRDAGKHCKSEENAAIKELIQKWVKHVGFRRVKFAKDEKLKEFTEEVYKFIEEDGKLSVPNSANFCTNSDFLRIYEGCVAANLADRRSYAQTGMLAVCRGE